MQAFIHKSRTILLYATICAIPWFFLPITQEYFLTQKFYLIFFTVLVSMLFVAISLLFSKKISIFKTSFDKILIFFGLSQIIAVVFSSTNKIQALTTVPWGLVPVLACIGFYFVLVNTLTKKNQATHLATTLITGMLVAAIVAVVFWFEPFKNAQLSIGLDFLKSMRFSPIGNILDTLILTGLLATISVVGVAHNIVSNKKPSILLIAGMIVGLSAFLLIGFRAMFPPQGQQALQLPPLEASWVATVDSMKSLQTAVVGVGIDNYERAFTTAKPRSYNATDYWQVNFNLSSSMLLHIWTETGLLGLLTYLLLWVYIIREIHGLFAENDKDSKVYAAWAAYLGIVTFCLPVSFITLIFTILLCASLSLKAHTYGDEEITLDVSKLPLLYIPLSIVLIAAVLGFGYLGSRAYMAEVYFKNSVDGVRKNDGKAVYNNLVNALQSNPYIERYHVQFSQVNLLLANNIAKKEELSDTERQEIARFIQVAISEAKVPVQLNPGKVGYWNNLAVVYRNIINVAEGAESWTIASYRRAILQDPNNPLIRLNLGGVYYSLKDYEEAEKLFEVAAALKPDWANAFYNLAWAQFQNKKYDNAVANLESVLKTLDKESEDYKKAQENLEAFKAAAADTKKKAQEASDSAAVRQGSDLGLPEDPKPQLSPAIQLPEDAGPESEIKTVPSPAAIAPTGTGQTTPTTAPTN